MDPDDLLHAENGSQATHSLLQDYNDDETRTNLTTPLLEPISSSFGSSVAFVGDVAGNAGRLAGIHEKTKPTISTMTYILITMVLLMICLFVAAVFMPQTSTSAGHHHHREYEPTGIHISLTGNVTEMYVQFATVEPGESIVEFAKLNNDSSWIKVKGTSTTYAATDMCQEPATSLSGFVSPGHLHTVKLYDLVPNTNYMYRVGLIGVGRQGGVQWSEESYRFRTSSPPGGGGGVNHYSSSETMSTTTAPAAVTFLAFADQGYSDSKSHGSQQVARLISSIIINNNNNPQIIDSIHHIGDLCYADGVSRIWDAWLDMIQPYASRVPYMVANGNHEYDHTAGGSGGKDPSGEVSEFGFRPNWDETSFRSTGGECGVPISARFAMPKNGNSVFWYSYDQALVHTAVLSSEHNMTIGSRQYAWLEKDLRAVNRSITPWIVVEMHRPMYSGSPSDHLVELGMQEAIEDLLYLNRVDAVLSGHFHAYVRSCDGLYAHNCANGGPVYLTVGTGGQTLSAGPTLFTGWIEHSDIARFGVGKATVYNATVMHWEFISVGGDVLDEAWIRRDR